MKKDSAKAENFVCLRRGIIEHIRRVNWILGKDKKPGHQRAPTPWGLLVLLIVIADFRNGVCSLTEEQLAEIFGCHARSIRRAMQPLLKQGYLERPSPNRPDVFIPKYERWDEENEKWVRVAPPKLVKSGRSDKRVRTDMTRQVDKCVQAGGQDCPDERTDMSGYVDEVVQANSDKSLDHLDSQQPKR